jgi:hypothetical protein
MRLSIKVWIIQLVCFFSINGIAQRNENQVSVTKQTDRSILTDSIIGEYSGQFFGSELKIVLQTIKNGEITGFDEHKGIRRPLKGTYTVESNTLQIILNEPGDHKYDGIIALQIDTTCFCGSGTWKSFKGKMEHPIEQIRKQTSAR